MIESPKKNDPSLPSSEKLKEQTNTDLLKEAECINFRMESSYTLDYPDIHD